MDINRESDRDNEHDRGRDIDRDELAVLMNLAIVSGGCWLDERSQAVHKLLVAQNDLRIRRRCGRHVVQ